MRIDPRASSVRVRDREIGLTPIEVALLTELVSGAGRVVRRTELLQMLWGQIPSSARTIDAHIKSIRRKLGPDRDCIETVRGVGYRFSESGPS